MATVHQQVIQRARQLVLSQVGHVIPTNLFSEPLASKMVEAYDNWLISQSEVEELVRGKRFISDEVLLSLAEEMTVATLYSKDGWVESVEAHIVLHAYDCADLHERMRAVAGSH